MEELLKDHYYRVDPAEYFERRLWGIIALADMKADSIKWDATDDDSLFAQFRGVLKDKRFEVNVPPGDTLSSRTMASIESYTLMQHVIETALRLFVASGERVAGNSLMLKLVNMRLAADFRDALKPLLGAAARHTVQKDVSASASSRPNNRVKARDAATSSLPDSLALLFRPVQLRRELQRLTRQ